MRRFDGSVREDGIIVEVKTRSERPAKRHQPAKPKQKSEQPQSVSHVPLKAYVKPPKTAAERAARVTELLSRLQKLYPGATCALHHSNPWELLVATILSAQCTDERVNRVTPGLFAKYPTPEDFAAVRSEVLANDIRSTGFFNNKAKSVVGAAKIVTRNFGGQVPRTIDE